MGGRFIDPFASSPAWPQDSAVFAGSSAMDMSGGGPVFPGGTVLSSSTPGKLHGEEELLLLQSDGGLDFAGGMLDSILGAVADSPPVKKESSGGEQSGAGLPQFLLGEQPAAWPAAIAGEETPTQSFGGDDLLHENNNAYLRSAFDLAMTRRTHTLASQDDGGGELLSFAPGGNGAPPQMDQTEFTGGGLHHLDLSSLLAPPPPAAAAFNTTVTVTAAPKPRARARRGQATDPHSIAERLRREKISDRMKNLQELVPNSNKTDKASMLEEIIEYIKFLQLQTKVLSMSRLGAAEAVVPLPTESQNESSRSRSGERQHGGGGGEELFGDGDGGAAMEQEVAELMEKNMTAAMEYLQSRGLCLMPIALASAISTKKGTSAAAVWPQPRVDGCE